MLYDDNIKDKMVQDSKLEKINTINGVHITIILFYKTTG